MTDRVGQQLDDYRLIRLLGAGTFGEVYLGEHLSEHRQVAVKVLKLQLTADTLKQFLSDFGIAVIAHSERSLSTQEMAGTVPYMAPEQIQGKPRPASDQYALGIIVYEWLCGVRPFGGSQWQILSGHLSTPPPLLQQKV